jgi:hypothetical protein
METVSGGKMESVSEGISSMTKGDREPTHLIIIEVEA